MKILITLSFTFICFLSNSQRIQLAIFDEMGKVNDCSVYKNDSIIEQFEKIFQIKQGDKITITHNWYRDTTFFIQEKLNVEDTLYNDMVRYYLANIPEWRNIILLGLWNGDAYDLVDPLDAKLNHMYTWYKKIMALPLKVSAFGMLDNIVILDNVKNTISQMNYTTCKVTQSVVPQFELSRHYYFDYFYDALYTFNEKKGITEVFQIDINTGETKSITQLTDLLLPRF